MIKIISFYLAVMFLSVNAYAEIYKWKDAQGKVHYGDKPVVGGEQLNIKKTAVANPGNKQSREERRRKLIESFDEDRKDKKEKQAKKRKERAKLNAQCGRAKDTLRRYKEASGLYDVDKDGKRKFISNENREKIIRKTQLDIKKHCS